MGYNADPPNDVAHIQFRSRVAFKLVWVLNEEYDAFVLVVGWAGGIAAEERKGDELSNHEGLKVCHRGGEPCVVVIIIVEQFHHNQMMGHGINNSRL